MEKDVNVTNLAFKDDPEQHYTYANYKSWELKPGERFELIYGQAYMMAAPRTKHQRVQARISYQIMNFLVGKPCEAFNAPFDVRLFYEEDESDDTVVQPDILVVCDQAKIGEEAIHGAPDLVVEILSPSNMATEMQRKLELYRVAGVREYWLADPENKLLIVYRLENGEYLPRRFAAADTAVSTILPGLEIPLSPVFAA
jgi:Uma2 family endonuclease